MLFSLSGISRGKHILTTIILLKQAEIRILLPKKQLINPHVNLCSYACTYCKFLPKNAEKSHSMFVGKHFTFYVIFCVFKYTLHCAFITLNEHLQKWKSFMSLWAVSASKRWIDLPLWISSIKFILILGNMFVNCILNLLHCMSLDLSKLMFE